MRSPAVLLPARARLPAGLLRCEIIIGHVCLPAADSAAWHSWQLVAAVRSTDVASSEVRLIYVGEAGFP